MYHLKTINIFKDFVYLFLEGGEGREKETERNIDVWEIHELVASCMPLAGDLARNPGMYPDWELNQQPFGSQASTQSTEPHQTGLNISYVTQKVAQLGGSDLWRSLMRLWSRCSRG